MVGAEGGKESSQLLVYREIALIGFWKEKKIIWGTFTGSLEAVKRPRGRRAVRLVLPSVLLSLGGALGQDHKELSQTRPRPVPSHCLSHKI